MRVQNRYCPTCGHDHVEVKTWEIPEVPVIDREGVGKLEEKLTSLTSELESLKQNSPATLKLLTEIKNSIQTIGNQLLRHPKPSEEFISNFWENCPECKESWEKIKSRIEERAVNKFANNAHLFTDEHLKNCPECKAKLENLTKKEPVASTKFWWEEQK